MLKHAVLLNVLEHPVAAHVVLVSSSDAVKPAVVTDNCSAELGNIVLEVDKVLTLLVRDDVVEVNILVAPLEVVDDALVGEFLLHDEEVLEKLDNSLVDIEVVELGNHGLLVLQVLLIRVDQRIPLIDDATDVVEHLGVGVFFQVSKRIVQGLVLAFLTLQLEMHILDLSVVSLELSQNHILVSPFLELAFDLVEVLNDLRQLVGICLLRFRFLQELAGFFLELVDLILK